MVTKTENIQNAIEAMTYDELAQLGSALHAGWAQWIDPQGGGANPDTEMEFAAFLSAWTITEIECRPSKEPTCPDGH